MNDPKNRKYFANIEECMNGIKIMRKMETRKCRRDDDFTCPICDTTIRPGEMMTIFRVRRHDKTSASTGYIACHDGCVARIKMRR